MYIPTYSIVYNIIKMGRRNALNDSVQPTHTHTHTHTRHRDAKHINTMHRDAKHRDTRYAKHMCTHGTGTQSTHTHRRHTNEGDCITHTQQCSSEVTDVHRLISGGTGKEGKANFFSPS